MSKFSEQLTYLKYDYLEDRRIDFLKNPNKKHHTSIVRVRKNSKIKKLEKLNKTKTDNWKNNNQKKM
ncbi:MAG: hypothetical protein Q8853_02990 [Candidatus Phytoplasma australasiaticum]|nr:hypothetical protein [Candidatus Phytoplasma australasiaticum]